MRKEANKATGNRSKYYRNGKNIKKYRNFALSRLNAHELPLCRNFKECYNKKPANNH